MPWRLIPAALFALALGGCLSRKVDVVPLVPPTETATLDELVAVLNRWEDVHSIVLRVDLQFETVEAAETGEGRQYRTAQGRLLLQRPNHIRLNIEAPILSANIAEMASNGERFQLLIHPPEYRALIEGRNDASYDEETAKLDQNPELEKAGPLVNIRPQHFTDAFLLTPVRSDPYTVPIVQEELALEPDARPGAKPGTWIRKSYYVVTVVRLGEDAPRIRYWFDRTGELLLSRQQVYDRNGRLTADIYYSGYMPPWEGTGPRFASRVRIERPHEDYALVVNVKRDGTMVNRELPATAFTVQAPDEWEGSLRRIDLDAGGEKIP